MQKPSTMDTVVFRLCPPTWFKLVTNKSDHNLYVRHGISDYHNQAMQHANASISRHVRIVDLKDVLLRKFVLRLKLILLISHLSG